MKKIFVLIMLCFTMLNIFGKEVNAEEIYEGEYSTLHCAKPLEMGTSFNILKGCTTKEALMNTDFFNYYINDIEGHLLDGTMYIEGVIKGNNQEKIIRIYFYSSHEMLYKCQVTLDDVVIYEFLVDDYEPTEITVCCEVDLNKEMGYSEDGFELCDFEYKFYYGEDAYYGFNGGFMDEFDDPDLVRMMGFKCLYVMSYKINGVYDSNIVHFITETSNLLTIDEIVDSIYVEDETDGNVENIEIIDNEYILVDGFIDVGTYSFTIKAMDNAGNITLQECVIDVYDVTPPKITGRNWKSSYTICAGDSLILSLFTVTDVSEYELSIIEDNYTANYNIPGVYTITAQAVDASGNTGTETIEIEVIDNIAPLLTVQKNIVVNTLNDYTLEDLRKYISVYDHIDGEIIDYEIVDLDNYLNNKTIIGYYVFQVTAKDKSNNSITIKFSIRVDDTDYPQIYTEEYTIVVSETYKITKEEIIEILRRSGQISSDRVSISSSYDFEADDNQVGIYNLRIVDSDGNIYNNSLEVVEDIEIDYSPVVKEEEKDYTKTIIICSCAGGLIIIIGALGIIIYKKKH